MTIATVMIFAAENVELRIALARAATAIAVARAISAATEDRTVNCLAASLAVRGADGAARFRETPLEIRRGA
jgi:hypothetical protein